MRITKGVEWAAHACAMLAPLPKGSGLSAASLAEYHDVPAAYMAKQMQALSRAKIVSTSRGTTGGYCLARSPAEISLWDITAAVDGSEPAFKCEEIRQNGPCGAARADCKKACPIAAGFAQAEQAYRDVLKSIDLVQLLAMIGEGGPRDNTSKMMTWYGENVTQLSSKS